MTAGTSRAAVAPEAVIGVHDGHNASAALIANGRVELAIQEERFTRIKNQGDVPANAFAEALRRLKSNETESSIHRAARPPRVALNGLYMNHGQWRRETILEDYRGSDGFKSRLKQPLKNTIVDRVYRRKKATERQERLETLGIDSGQMVPVEHHLAHASAAYYTSPWAQDPLGKTLVLTCDGSGDRLSATVSVGEGTQLRRIAAVSEQDSIGRLYALVTRWLGMSPQEHEYKVMGLAPYVAAGALTGRAAERFTELFEFSSDGLSWRRRSGVPSMYSAQGLFDRLLKGQRFDLIAAGAQGFIESMLTRWVRNAIRETGLTRVACSGGVFMNVKANLALLEIPELENLYVFPSCGDESNSIGAACCLAAESGQSLEPLGPIYYGEPIVDREVESSLEQCAASRRLKAYYSPQIEALTARKLAEGRIVARASGAIEFGARALGNRSILARADSPVAVRVINQMVKNRDFWMPFAPSVLAERANDYYRKPKPVNSPYMMFAFPSKTEKRGAFGAAQHPYDFTTRPHEVREDHNPNYYRMLKEYESLTGEGIILNTSFNLHGEPIVYRAHDALDVFLRSGLECMALGNWWVEKTGK